MLFRSTVLSAVRADGFLRSFLSDESVSALHAGGLSAFQPVGIEVHGIVVAPQNLFAGKPIHGKAKTIALSEHENQADGATAEAGYR